MRSVPKLETDADAEAFLDQDLSDLDFSQFKPLKFEIEPDDGAVLTMRVPPGLLDAVKQEARREGVPYRRFIRRAIEGALARKDG